jgi:hypothetical protein
MKRLFSKFIEFRFTDSVNGRAVNLYECKDGTRFLAHSKFDSLFFHVKMEKSEQPIKCEHPIRRREGYREGLYKCWECGKVIFED